MPVIEDFLEHYNREVDHYTAAASAVKGKLESALARHGIRAIVTSRAKGIRRLRDKVVKRNRSRKYKSLKAIYEDIIDLAGVRVALYFPGDRERAAAIVGELFSMARNPKVFPEGSPKNQKKFCGYVATHYLVRLKGETETPDEDRFTNTNVEVQVASVLMHAWAEVEHDLEYKPESGIVSEEESAILDEVNGLVLTGELALERLQKAIERRVLNENAEFQSPFDLATFLAERAKREGISAKEVGRVDALFAALVYLKLATPKKLGGVMIALTRSEKNKPLADTLIDRLLARNKRGTSGLAKVLSQILTSKTNGPERAPTKRELLGSFLIDWQALENAVRQMVLDKSRSASIPFMEAVKAANLPQSLVLRLHAARLLRNRTVHGISEVDSAALKDGQRMLRAELLPELRKLAEARRNKFLARLPAPETS